MSLRDRLPARVRDGTAQADALLATIQANLHQRIVIQLAAEGNDHPGGAWGEPDLDLLRIRVGALATTFLEADHPNLTPDQCTHLVKSVCDDVVAFGPITPLLVDPSITEVMVNGPHSVYVERAGRMEKTAVQFRDSRHVIAVVDKILTPIGRRVDESSPMADARLPDGSRVHIVIPPVSLHGPCITVRKFRADLLEMESMVEKGSLTLEMAGFLRCCVQSRLCILVSGGTASGKTTLLNALSGYIPTSERIITIEDAAELRLRQGHVVALESRTANMEGKGEVAIRDLLRNALRMRPDRIVIGEVRGGEALDLLQAMNTGHDGSLSTLHANSTRDALARLETMALMSLLELPARVVRQQIAAAVDIVIHQERFEDGSRRVTHISEVHGMEGEMITLQDVFFFERFGIDATGQVMGRFHRSPVRPATFQTFGRFGLKTLCWNGEQEATKP